MSTEDKIKTVKVTAEALNNRDSSERGRDGEEVGEAIARQVKQQHGG